MIPLHRTIPNPTTTAVSQKQRHATSPQRESICVPIGIDRHDDKALSYEILCEVAIAQVVLAHLLAWLTLTCVEREGPQRACATMRQYARHSSRPRLPVGTSLRVGTANGDLIGALDHDTGFAVACASQECERARDQDDWRAQATRARCCTMIEHNHWSGAGERLGRTIDNGPPVLEA